MLVLPKSFLITRDFVIQNGCHEDTINKIADKFFPGKDSVTLEELESVLSKIKNYGYLGIYLTHARWVAREFGENSFNKVSEYWKENILCHGKWVTKEFGEANFGKVSIYSQGAILAYAKWVTKEFGEANFSKSDCFWWLEILNLAKWVDYKFRKTNEEKYLKS